MKIKLPALLLVFIWALHGYAADSLLTRSAFMYLGSFRIENVGVDDWHGSPYGGTAIGFNPSGNSGAGSLYVNWFDQNGPGLAEVSIPTTLSTSSTESDLPSAVHITPSPYYFDISDGDYVNLGVNGTTITNSNGYGTGGIYRYENEIIATTYGYCGGGSYLPLTKYSSADLTAGSTNTRHGLNLTTFGAGYGDYHSGAIGGIPAAYQEQLGGTLLLGAMPSNMSIVSRSSYGPGIVSFDPSNLGANNTVSATANGNALCMYPQAHQTLGSWDDYDANQYFSIRDSSGALIFPDGSRTVLVVGEHGNGTPWVECPLLPETQSSCYGFATDNCSLHGTDAGGHDYCYDPPLFGNGSWVNSAWPYSNYVWAYDVGDASGNNTTGNNTNSADATHPELNNLTAVRLGLIDPWDIIPYDVWPLPDVNDDPSDGVVLNWESRNTGQYASGCYDPATGRAYFAVSDASQWRTAIIEVYQITVPGGEIYTDPTVTITSPTTDFSTTASTITVMGTTTKDDALTITGVSVNGTPATSSDGFATWTATVSVSVGGVTLTATVTDSEGQTGTDSVTGTRTEIQSGAASFRGVSASGCVIR